MLYFVNGMQIIRARVTLSFSTRQRHCRRAVSTNCPVVETPQEAKTLKSWKEIPGPPSLPFLGVFHNFLPGGKLAGCKGSEMTNRLHQLYGPIVKFDATLGAKRKVFLFDPQEVENVMRNEEPMPMRPIVESLEYYRKRHNKTYDPSRRTGVGTDHGTVWRNLRSILNPILMQPKTIQLYADAMEAVVIDMIKRLRYIRDSNNRIPNLDLQMNRWSLESIALVALGTRLNCFDPNLPEDSPASQLIKNINVFFKCAEALDMAPSAWKLYATPTFKKAMRINEEIERLIKHFIKQAIKTREGLKKESETSSTSKSVLEKLLEIDPQLAVLTATELLIGGVDSTANTVLSTLYHLAKHPDKQNKLREEISMKHNQKRYLKACISESLRLLPPGVGNLRQTTKEHDILGYKIPTNVQVIFCIQSMSILEKYFPKPDQFIPERWLVEKDDPQSHGNAQVFATMPFGFGVRSCIGRRIAQLEMETLIPKLVENFQLDWTSGEPVQVEAGLVNQIKDPIHFSFRDL